MIKNSNRQVVVSGLSDYLKIKVVRANQDAPAPSYPYLAYTITTFAGANNGTFERHSDGIYRKQVRQIWSITSKSDDDDESVENASKAKDWLEHIGRAKLRQHGITVQSVTDITNRDNVLTNGYEYSNGFDVVFYVYDEIDSKGDYIENVETNRIL